MNERRAGNGWVKKFSCAFRGVLVGSKGNKTNSFFIHVPAAIGVFLVGMWRGLTKVELTILVLCIALVFVSELFNSGLESLAKAVTSDDNPYVRDALDIASGAVLVASLFAVMIGIVMIV